MSQYGKILKKRAELRAHYLGNLDEYLKRIKDFFEREFGEVTVYVFGSMVNNQFDSESDVDILVISPNTPPYLYQRSRILTRLFDQIGFMSPFEIHLVSPEEYEDWYKQFIKEVKHI